MHVLLFFVNFYFNKRENLKGLEKKTHTGSFEIKILPKADYNFSWFQLQ